MLNKGFNLSKIALSDSEIANLKGFEIQYHQGLVNYGLRQETTTIEQLSFVQDMGVMCVLLSIGATQNKVNEDWQFYQNSILHIQNRQKNISVINKDGTTARLNNAEFCFAISILAACENMVVAARNSSNFAFGMSYFYKNYLSACLLKIPSTAVSLKKVMSFVKANKTTEYNAIESQVDNLLNNF
ncbi:hypothetical protein [Acinetobacter sp. P1(2025)]|uniref:hypothetical protein n=1 Tax=Acinetobacter sp. P1(2025) TaxID=3446120 RepID=UPI003F5374CD